MTRISVTEPQVGIKAYLNDAPGFQAILKQRYTDFIVREVGEDGEVVRLTEFEAHESKKVAARKRAREEVDAVDKRMWWSKYLTVVTDGDSDDPEARKAKRARISSVAKRIENFGTASKGAVALAPQTLQWGRYLVGGPQALASLLDEKLPEVVSLSSDHEEGVQAVATMFAGGGVDWGEKIKAFTLEALVQAEKAKAGISRDEKREQKEKEEKDGVPEVVLPPITDKKERTECHGIFKKYFAGVLMCDTIDDPAGGKGKSVRVRRAKGRGHRDQGGGGFGKGKGKGKGGGGGAPEFDPRGSNETWPDDRPDFLKFCLYKQNMDTMSAVQQLTAWLRIKDSRLKYAGTKDKRAVTSQWCTAFKISAERMGACMFFFVCARLV